MSIHGPHAIRQLALYSYFRFHGDQSVSTDEAESAIVKLLDLKLGFQER